MTETTDAATIFAPIWKRKWIILLVGILVAAGAYEYYKHKSPVYSDSTQLYLGGGSEEAGQLLGGSSVKRAALNPANQTALINSVLISEGVRKQLRAEKKTRITRSALRGVVKASSKEKSQFISVNAEAGTPAGAALLANLTAKAYIHRESEKFRRAVETAIAVTHKQIRRIESPQRTTSKGKGSKAAGVNAAGTIELAGLNSKLNQLESELSTSGVQQIGTAKPSHAVLLSPKPKQNAIFGFVIGIVLASIAAYLLTRFDRRVRSLGDVESIFHTSVLAALPTVKRPVVHEDGKPRPSASLLEPLRRLHTALEVGDVLARHREEPTRAILFLSADAADGKSTIIADLALVQRDAGKRVAIVEADFRRPVQSRLLGLEPSQGLAEVLGEHVTPSEVMQMVRWARAEPAPQDGDRGGAVATVVESRAMGSLSVLPSGGTVANPPALLASAAMSDTLHSIAREFDYVLIDAPSPLEVSDVIPLLALVDGIVVVARVGHTREVSATRLAELLERTPSTPVLGVVANHVRAAEIARYGFSSVADGRRRGRKSLRR